MHCMLTASDTIDEESQQAHLQSGRTMTNFDEIIAGPLGIVLALLIIIWCVLMFFAPFFWYGTSRRAKEISEKLDILISHLAAKD